MTATVEPGTTSATRMRARAHLRTRRAVDGAGRARTELAALRSQAPLTLRPTIPRRTGPSAVDGAEPARVSLTAAAAGPVGGDDLALTVHVGAGTTLVLDEVSATLLLPGADGARSLLRIRVCVEEGATLVWLPEPVIAARGCHHVTDVAVDLAPDSRLLMREEVLLGRHGEASGRFRQLVRVHRDGRPVHRQDLRLGAEPGRSPVVVGAHRAVGSLLVVEPALPPVETTLLGEDGALFPLACDGAALAQGLSADSIGLRGQLDRATALLDRPWTPRPTPTRRRDEHD
ncbi:urease accessory protein UreD [Actinophytocola sp. NPDC049390]|uniref:urease accessory protein UreD n=1 Tax=Actinophytocola sp. NPDC049390 TaxID=3363894 RepID=UPI00378F9357